MSDRGEERWEVWSPGGVLGEDSMKGDELYCALAVSCHGHDPIHALHAGLRSFQAAHGSTGGFNVSEPHRYTEEFLEMLFSDAKDDRDKLKTMLGLVWALESHIRSHFNTESGVPLHKRQ